LFNSPLEGSGRRGRSEEMDKNGRAPNDQDLVLDEMDRAILNEIQSHFPIEPRPYRALGEKLGCSEAEMLGRVRRLKEGDVIRRIGANFNSRRLGYTSTLCAARVPPEIMDRFLETVNSYRGVTHNYRRDHEYNIWFTLIAPSEEEIERTLEDLAAATGVREILSLPAEKIFKIRVDFEM
jgi:DNA-binding Lrp family transcriptional regulator